MKRKLLNNDYLLSMISKFSNILFGFLSLIFLNRFLGAYLKGKYTSILNYVTLISSILQFGICIIYPKFKRKNIENIFEIFISLSIIQAMFYSVLSIILCSIIKNNNLLWICLLSIISILTTQLRYINLVENIKYNTFVVVIMSFFNFINTAISFIFLKRNLYTGLILYLLKDLIIIFLILKQIEIKRVFKKSYFKYYKSIFISGIFPMLSNLLIIINYKIDILMLNSYRINYTLIGLYSLGLSISEYMWIIPDIFKDVVQKRTAKSNSIETINFSLRMSTSLLLFAFLILIVSGKNLFGLIFGKEYTNSFFITIILFIGVYSMIYYKIIGQLFIADNKSKIYFFILLLGAIANIILNSVLIPIYSIYGAAFASVISYSIIGVLFLIIYMIFYKVKFLDVIIIQKKDILKFFELVKRKKVK